MKKSDFTILVADDDPDYLFQTVNNLGRAGYKTVAVESQAEAESRHRSVIADIVAPGCEPAEEGIEMDAQLQILAGNISAVIRSVSLTGLIGPGVIENP